MAAVTPRRSARIPHTHTPKMSDRKKSLFQIDVEPPRESLTQHRRLPVVDSESDSDDCDLGIIATLDSSSGDELQDRDAPTTPERPPWLETRSRSTRLLKENNDLKSFIKSPFTLKKYHTRYSHPETECTSTPVTPHVRNHPTTPSSTHSCASAHTFSSSSSRARKSLASLIADAESCSSSLKDLNFDTDSGTDSKENTPTKRLTRSGRRLKMTPKFATFKGVLMEQKTNVTSSPGNQPVVCLTKMDFSNFSPTQMLKTPHNSTDNTTTPPKIGHNKERRPAVEIAESPESSNCDSEKSHKRLRNDSLTEQGPNSKYPKLDTSGSAPKARLSLFNLKELLSTKSFYGKSNPDLNASITKKIENAIVATTHTQQKRHISHSHRRKSRKPGQINLGVKHRIRKPKLNKSKLGQLNRSGGFSKSGNESGLNNSTLSDTSANNSTLVSQNSSQELDNDKVDPFTKEQQTIAALLSQWTEEDGPTELTVRPSTPKAELPCFNKTVIEETNDIFQPVTATRVQSDIVTPQSEVILELGAKPECHDVVMEEGHVASHGEALKGFLPVEGGYIVVDEPDRIGASEEELTDLDAIERELQMLDEQILHMAQSNNINVDAVLASSGLQMSGPTEATNDPATSTETTLKDESAPKLFPIFSNPNPGNSTPSSKVSTDNAAANTKKPVLKSVSNQYVIDAGQKRFGATQCKECGVIYEIGDPQDEHAHLVHHNATDVLRFNGWKEERVVGTWGGARCLLVRGADAGWKRVQTLLERVVHPHLGYGAALPSDLTYSYTAYLYIEKKQVIGCLIMEPKARAYKLVSGDPDCCSVEDYPVKCGVSRVWTHISHRRRGVAARMLDCARASLLYGQGVRVDEIAFSAPTAAGKALAAKYCGTEHFYVYLE